MAFRITLGLRSKMKLGSDIGVESELDPAPRVAAAFA